MLKKNACCNRNVIQRCQGKGYEVTCNIMAISNAKESDIDQALEMVGQSSADGIYIVDSYGALYPEQIRAIADKYTELGEKYGKYIGMHAHNEVLCLCQHHRSTLPRCQSFRCYHDVHGTGCRKLCHGTASEFSEKSEVQCIPGTPVLRRLYAAAQRNRCRMGI